jgi:hypothetical protein
MTLQIWNTERLLATRLRSALKGRVNRSAAEFRPIHLRHKSSRHLKEGPIGHDVIAHHRDVLTACRNAAGLVRISEMNRLWGADRHLTTRRCA